MCLVLNNGELLVCVFPAAQVLFSMNLAECCQGDMTGLTASVAAAPLADDAGDGPTAFVALAASGPGGEES
eukprot:CAMPEP_0198528800 /NCGR_PEP_ID=MMETSP1462-20131121/25374_1 /TAXON_ID=1333877 /ORGANISM="Brandtodinium nutriculum, Strain RCC3387" /LENGTH=70 /DNA_ID=CAMNT_0044258631 /DNA_START=29 /DNA_END=238 /DNA_ORIENTATION=+